MNSTRTTTTAVFRRNLTPLLCVAALLCAGTALGQKKDDPASGKRRPIIYPIKSRPYGKTYSEWAGAWWRWAYSFPAGEDNNPVQDLTGDLAGLGQSGPVWFLAGTFGQTATRTATVPSDKALFFPIINTLWINIPELGDNPWSDEQRDFAQDFIAPFIDNAYNLSCQIDGVEVKNIEGYRTATPDGKEYMISFPENNLWGLEAGVYGPSVDDGIYLMLAPLSPGKHTIRFTAASVGFDGSPFALDVTYNLKVVRPARIFPPQSHPYGRSYAQWSAKFWKTGIELPAAGNPYVEGGCGELSGRVMFLAGPIGSTTISCTVPAGTALFVPALTVECSSLEPPESGFHGDTEEEQAECATWWSDHIVNPSVEINGLPVPNLANYRVVSPQFEFTAPDPNILGVAGGGAGTAVADGYYVMVAPLSRGVHTIRIRGSLRFSMADGDPFDLDLTADNLFYITVE
jgi:hypothetical protein